MLGADSKINVVAVGFSVFARLKAISDATFKLFCRLFGDQIYAYYFDIPFEETMKRHKTRHEHSFGEETMRSWWNEKDYLGFIPEYAFTSQINLDDEVEIVMNDIQVED